MKRFYRNNHPLTFSLISALVCVVFFVALLGYVLPSISGSYNSQRILLLLLIWAIPLLVMGVWFFSPPSREFLRPFIWFAPVVLVFLSGLLYEADYKVESLFFAFYFSSIGLLGLFLADKNYLEVFIEVLLLIGALVVFLYSAVALMIYVFALRDGVTELYEHIPWGVPQYRYWSHLATWLLPLMPLMANQTFLRHSAFWKLLVAASAGVWWWIVFLSMARGSAAAILMASLVALVLFRKNAAEWLKLSVLYALIGAGLWLTLSTLLPRFLLGDLSLHTVHATTSGRIPQWVEAFTMSLQNFPLGIGPQSWLTHSTLTDAYRDSYRWGHPHNMYLLWAAEYGWIAIFALAIVFYRSGLQLFRLAGQLVAERAQSTRLVGFTVSVVGALAHAGVSAVFMGPASMLVGLLVLAAFWGLVNRDESRAASSFSSQGLKRWKAACLFSVIILFSAGAWWAGQVKAYHDAMIIDRESYTKGGRVPAFALPRFWLHGDFPRRDE